MPCKGSRIPDEHDNVNWPILTTMQVLGHLVSYDGSSWPCLEAGMAASWRVFFATVKSPKCSQLTFREKQSILRRQVQPVFIWRASRWCITKAVLRHVLAMHRTMLSCMIKVQRDHGEDQKSYFLRRARQVASICRPEDSWAYVISQRVVSWRDHIQRSNQELYFPIRLFNWRDSDWLMKRRVSMGSRSALGGITRTRVVEGHPVCRWQDGAATAQEFLAFPTI